MAATGVGGCAATAFTSRVFKQKRPSLFRFSQCPECVDTGVRQKYVDATPLPGTAALFSTIRQRYRGWGAEQASLTARFHARLNSKREDRVVLFTKPAYNVDMRMRLPFTMLKEQCVVWWDATSFCQAKRHLALRQ